MNCTVRSILARVSLAVLSGAMFTPTVLAQDRPPDVQAGVQVLTRGPVHEAFAETVTFNPEPGIVVTKEPPKPVEEVPPDQRPAGADVAWIPGYWAWDSERNDFLWVSGIWRNVPPDRQWVPGYWAKVEGGWQWMAGYWAPVNATETMYLPEPPASIEAGPNVAAPGPDSMWVPGCWVWHEGRYTWRPGFWMTGRPDWVWVPGHYVYAPRGYVYCDGYWDYVVVSRGVLFAPVYVEPVVVARPAFVYEPVVAINLNLFADHLFVRPACHHYYFGDYYAPRYYDEGIYASFSFTYSRYGYDPIYANIRFEHRDEPNWDRHVREVFMDRREHEDARPPHTLTAQTTVATGPASDGATRRAEVLAAPFKTLASKEQPVRLQPVAKEEKEQHAGRAREVESFRGERKTVEAARLPAPPTTRPEPRPEGRPEARPEPRPEPAPPSAPSRPEVRPERSEPDRARLPRSPIVARPIEQGDRARAVPQRPEFPAPDMKIEPRSGERGRPEPPQAMPRENAPGRGKGKDKGGG